MKKIPTLFERVYEGHKVVGIKNIIAPGCEQVLIRGIPTIKYDGSCCAIIDGKFYKRYNCKKGKTPPDGAIACCDPDPITGHWPHWVRVNENDSSDKWFIKAYNANWWSIIDDTPDDGTYEAIGYHFQGNPYGLFNDILVAHGKSIIDNLYLSSDIDESFCNIRKYLRDHPIEGIVFWMDGKPACKIKRTDFGFEWPIRSIEWRNWHEYI